MKKTLLVTIMVSSAILSFSQMTTSYDASKIKDLKTIVALQEYPKKAGEDEKNKIDSLNANLSYAMKEYWDYNDVSDYMPLSEAKEFVKKNKGYCYVTINEGVSSSTTIQGSYRYVSYAEKLSVYMPKIACTVYLPYYEGIMTKTCSVYATMQMNKILDLLYKEEIKNIMSSQGYVKKNGPKIIQKTLLIPKEYVSPKLSSDDIKLAYPYDLDMCDLNKIEKVILDKNPKYAVAFYVPIPVGGKIVHRVYISNAEDGDIYGVMDGSKVALDLGIFGSIGGQENKKYLINEKELKQLSKIVE